MNKKAIIGIVLVGVVLIAGGVIWAFWDNINGAAPAILPPSEDITQSIPPSGSTPAATNTTGMPLQLPPGFSISIYAKNVNNARALGWDPVGRLALSMPSQGKVVVFDDTNGVASSPIPIIENLNKPHGFVFRCETSGQCKVYIAEVDAVSVYTYDLGKAKATNRQKILDLPAGGNHTSRTLALIDTESGPRLLVSTGSSCNVCNEEDPRRAAIWSSKLDGSDFKPYATGLRNSVFLAIHPVTGKLWGTEMGRDLLGDNTPPDEVNIIEGPSTSSGQAPIVPDYGWPICYGKNTHDTDFDRNKYIQDPCTDKVASHIDLQAHSAPLGLGFIPEEGWPEQYWHDLLVAFHGSWNRTTPTGYKIVRYDLDSDGNVQGVSDFITGFLPANSKAALGRPVDILVQPGGTLYISDDKAGVIYKLTKSIN